MRPIIPDDFRNFDSDRILALAYTKVKSPSDFIPHVIIYIPGPINSD